MQNNIISFVSMSNYFCQIKGPDIIYLTFKSFFIKACIHMAEPDVKFVWKKIKNISDFLFFLLKEQFQML